MHDEHFISCWLRDDTEGKAEEVENMNKNAQE